MGFIEGVRSIFNREQSFARPEAPSRLPTISDTMWQPVGGNSVPETDTYDNIFPYVNAISQRFSTIIPYAIDVDGRRINPTPAAVSALYAPNDTYSAREFLNFIASSLLTQTHLDVLIWTSKGGKAIPGGNVKADNIVGYSFLPQNSREYNSTHTDWTHRVNMSVDGVEDQYEFTRNETIALTYSHHPADPRIGVAPAMTITKWANVDDMIADYERGFFGNGAVPAGMMGIVSETGDDFIKNKNRLEDTFRGAGNNNGVVYNWVPVDPETHKPSQTGKLVWVPFQQSNNTLDLSTVNDVVNGRLSNALAVPDIIRGIDNGQTYANAEQAERSFIENTLQPLLLTVWDKWQFELDRICGDLGYGITFDLNLPAQTDVEQVRAETQQTQVTSLLALIDHGATAEQAARALGLSSEYAQLTLTQQATPTVAVPSVSTTPQLSAQKKTLRRSEFDAHIEPDEQDSYDRALKATQQFYKRLAEYAQSAPSDEELNTISLEWVDSAFAAYEDRIIDYANQTGTTLLEAIQELAKTDKQIAKILDDTSAAHLEQLSHWETIPETIRTEYMNRLSQVAKDATQNGLNSIQTILEQAQAEEWERDYLQEQLEKLTTGSRAELLARNELVNSQRLGSYYSARNMGDDLHVQLEKQWNSSHDATVCDFCRYMDGKTVDIDGTFMENGDEITIGDITYVNDWMSKTTCDGHPNCRCYQTYIVKGAKQ